MEQRLPKIEAAWPKELKAGQTFKSKTGQVVEIFSRGNIPGVMFRTLLVSCL